MLWKRLRDSKTGYKFRRQFPLDIYVLDFYCARARLCVEVDGNIHELQKDKDWERDGNVLARGIRTVRFSTQECMNDLDDVVGKIIQECESQIAAGFGPKPRRLRFPTV